MWDTALRDGEVQGDEVQACCSLRGFPKIHLLQLEENLRLSSRTGEGKSLPCWRGEIPARQPGGWEATREGDWEGGKDNLAFQRPFLI